MKNPLWQKPGLDRLITVTVTTMLLFVVQIVMSHITHSLTLLVAAYHMLYNIMSLLGCIATIKICQRGSSLSNTFGWARLEVLSMVVNLLFLFALCFSMVVEAVQTMIHYDHMDAMHQPDIVCIVAALGLVVNILCILLIGGFTHHQGSFLALTSGGEVVIHHGTATQDAVRLGLRQIASSHRPQGGCNVQQQSIEETETDVMMDNPTVPSDGVKLRMTRRWPAVGSMFRDISSSVIALASAIVVYLNGESLASLLVDPLLTIVSVAILAYTSYPFIVEAGQILLQTTPAHIDVSELQTRLMSAFPSVVNIHELHVWALTPDRVISTAHLVFMNENVYMRVRDPIVEFFHSQGITRVTLQPEFHKFGNLTPAPSKGCILTCNKDHCKSMTCCNHQATMETKPCVDLESPADDCDHHQHHDHHHHHGHCHETHDHCEDAAPETEITGHSKMFVDGPENPSSCHDKLHNVVKEDHHPNQDQEGVKRNSKRDTSSSSSLSSVDKIKC